MAVQVKFVHGFAKCYNTRDYVVTVQGQKCALRCAFREKMIVEFAHSFDEVELE